MAALSSDSDHCILLTGGAGFIGKVVLETLVRRQKQHPFTKVTLLLRPGEHADVESRFHNEIAASPCFSLLPADWSKRVRVVTGDLTQHKCGLGLATYESVCRETTHVIHCAGAVKFDLPLQDAVASNTTSSLKLLALAKDCPRLHRMVCMSTAFVTPFDGKPMHEVLSPLPRKACDIFADIQKSRISCQALLDSVELPNTFTLSKNLAEHLVMERRENVSVTIVRPSFVSASQCDPFPGWTDSSSPLSGLMITVGVGLLHVLDGNPEALLDIVPVDQVADQVVEETFKSRRRDSAELGESHSSIVYVVRGKEHGFQVQDLMERLVYYFKNHVVGPPPSIEYIGSRRNSAFRYHEYVKHELPTRISKRWYTLCGETEKQQQLDFVDKTIHSINDMFPYFTHHTFDFRPKDPKVPEMDFGMYLHTIFRGIQRNLMKSDPMEVSLTSMTTRRRHSTSLVKKTEVGLAWDSTDYVLRTGLMKINCNITFDQESFDHAMFGLRDSPVVIIPSHTSYLDPMMIYYLLMERPDLGIQKPRIIASHQYADKPGIGWWLTATRGMFFTLGREILEPEEEKQLNDAIYCEKPLLLFQEGKGFRSQRFVSPREGILRSLQRTGHRFNILPVSVSTDCPPPDNAFSLGSDFGNNSRPAAQTGQLGRVHIRCGDPIPFDDSSDVESIRASISGQLQTCATATTFQLKCFADRLPFLSGINARWLRTAIEERGGIVVESALTEPAKIQIARLPTPRLIHNWQHLFFVEILLQRPRNPAIGHFIEENSFAENLPSTPDEDEMEAKDKDRLSHLLFHIFQPVCADYTRVAMYVRSLPKTSECVAIDLMRTRCSDYTTAQSALRCLVANDFLLPAKDGRYFVSASDGELDAFVEASRLTQVVVAQDLMDLDI